ncbi:transferase hexapeptide (six repeat-containing protein) [Methanolobus vulcani]|uniref:Transferase hexapeptide (Six repeat-containing protein) n=1 Tax=Methanolobus vulcani TaxID=38026 RepID=A0A7Z7FD65_9EURY|nr:acyltransferase [Methanolobus vulcani]SDF24556.1 transferase hexapeptide (six repeat-containing protein) [Methanolobus vulcani]
MQMLKLMRSHIFFIKLRFKIKLQNALNKCNTQLLIGKNVQVHSNIWLRIGQNSILKIGDNSFFGNGCRIECSSGANLSIGNNVNFTGYDFIACMKSVKIGSNSLIGEFTSIRDSNHSFTDLDSLINSQGYTMGEIEISEDVWIGRGSIVLPNVSIGTHSVIGANSVVNTDVAQFSVVAGVPAREIKKLK